MKFGPVGELVLTILAQNTTDLNAERTFEALKGAGHPVIVRDIHGPDDLGRIFFFAEFAIAPAGWR